MRRRGRLAQVRVVAWKGAIRVRLKPKAPKWVREGVIWCKEWKEYRSVMVVVE